MMDIYFVRHGETNYNQQSRLNDNPALDVYLTQAGVMQACDAAEALKEVTIDQVFASELPRARRTASIINMHHLAPLLIDARLNDRRSGFEGQPKSEYDAAIRPDPTHIRPPGGESLQDEKARVYSFIDELLQRPYTSVLVVAHGETLKVASGYFQRLGDLEMLQLPIGNCQVLHFKR